MRPVAFERRVAALLLDALLFIPIGMVVVDVARQWVFGFAGRPSFRFTGLAGTVRPEDSFTLGMAAALLLYTASEALAGTSIGKRILGLRIGRRDGSRAGRQRMLFRWLIKYAPVVFYLGLFGTEWALFRGTGYALADESRLVWHALRLVLGALALLYGAGLLASVLLAALPLRRPIHDLVAGTAVFDVPLREATGGFEPVVAGSKSGRAA